MRRSGWRRGFGWALGLALLIGVSQANAVLIAGPDGSINTTPPAPDPGFANVGSRSGLSGVYVRNGWVLTANHVGPGPIELDGIVYEALPGSRIRFTNPSPPDPDLIAFKLERRPPLPDLVLASGPVALNQDVILIGRGQNRGASTTWVSPGGQSFDGWFQETAGAIRWGTNRVNLIDWLASTGSAETEAFSVTFDELTGSNSNDPEVQAVNGDSGGAVFVWNGAVSELIGILFARGSQNPAQSTQPSDLALFENISVIVDLDHYRSQILGVIDQPDCADGLDEDGDGLVDFPDDPGCDDAFDGSEWSAALICDNGLDDDGDQLIDYPEDDGCDDLLDPSEVPEPELPVALAAGVMALLIGARGGMGTRQKGQPAINCQLSTVGQSWI
jgi:hypothetical protein